MTPEERAKQCMVEWRSLPDDYPHLRSLIAAAIREAVEEERQECAAICDRYAELRQDDAKRSFDPFNSIENYRHGAAVKLAEAIRARSQTPAETEEER